MKQAKKFMAAILVLTMVSAAAPMSVFAGTVTEGDESPKTDGDFKVSYTYTPEPTYTVTIPPGVTLSDDGATTARISAEGVENLDGKMINVELTSGTYTNEGSTFHAKNGDSVVTYTISRVNDPVSVGDIVAEFESNGSQTLTFSKPDKSNATVAGEHKENLTFTVSLSDVTVDPSMVRVTCLDYNAATKSFESITKTALPISSAPKSGSKTTLRDGWYAVTENYDFDEILSIKGTVNLVLCDNTVLSGLHVGVDTGNTLNIYAQSTGDAQGALKALCTGSYPGIGSDNATKCCGNITINGGKITATSGWDSAAIGSVYSGNEGNNGDITINGGIVTATGGNNGPHSAGIGIGADVTKPLNVIINGGTVIASSGGENAEGIGKGVGATGTVNLIVADGMTVYGGDSENPTTKIASPYNSRPRYMAVKNSLIGTTFKDVDTVNLGNDVYVYYDDEYIYNISGDYTLRYLAWDMGRHKHNYQLGNGRTYISVPDDTGKIPTAIRVASGSGTALDPYKFSAVY